MTDWAAEAVTRGEFYTALILMGLQIGLCFNRQRIDIEHSPGKYVAQLAVKRLGETDTMLRQIRDRLPKDKPVRIACSKCGTVDSDMMHAECSTCWHDRA
jgi:hypothetical protein